MKYVIRINKSLVVGKHYEAIPISCIVNADELMQFYINEKDKAQSAADHFAKTITRQPNTPMPTFDFVPIDNLNK